MAAKQCVYLVRIGDAAIRAYLSKADLLRFIETIEPQKLQWHFVQRLEIGDVENKLEFRTAAELLALWKKASDA